MAQVEIVSERDGPAGWSFEIQVLDDAGSLRRHRLTLSWADYNLWSRSGSDEPGRVAAGVVGYLLSKEEPESLRPSFDAALARRLYADADEQIPRHIR